MSKKKESGVWFEEAGWTFFVVTTAVLAAPCSYVAWQLAKARISWFGRVGTGTLIAGILAGVFTWAVNAVLQARAAKRRTSQRRKKSKK